MAKFISHDGIDKNGVRAEVTVMTGTGTISEIIGRGKQNEDGSYRNVEVVFTPDNPLLKRKVYGLLDTTSAELWQHVKEAHEAGKNISYRIESQRRNGVDRSKPIGDLVPTEDVRRILAAVDTFFSHEAKTNPAEDPDNENPSALTQPAPAAHSAAAPVDTKALAAAVVAALGSSDAAPLFAANGKVNYGSPALARAGRAEQFALDHLVSIYAAGAATVEVTDEVLAQAGALALHLLALAERTHQGVVQATGTTLDAEASRSLALNVLLSVVGTRHRAPIGGDAATQKAWSEAVVEEASDRLYGVGMLAQGQAPKARPQAAQEPSQPREEAPPAGSPEYSPSTPVDVSPFVIPDAPKEGQDGFIAPDDALIARVRSLCETADVLDHPREISDWMESVLGSRSARKVHALALAEFCMHYEQAGPDRVRAEVRRFATAA